MREQVINRIEEKKVIAIMRGVEETKAVEVARALVKGGVCLMEVTFNQKQPETWVNTCKAISAIVKEFPDTVTVGAGTVTSVELTEMAKEAGAEFIVSPDTDTEVIKRTIELDMVSLPGAYTATEAKRAHNAGADFVKLFPCVDGPKYLKAVMAPLNHIKFLAVGGVSADNAADFIKAGAKGVGMGGNLVNKTWIENGEYENITKEAIKLMDSLE